MKNPLFTVLMPAYNTADYIKSAMTSVLDQEYRNWELLVIIDPATTDNTYNAAIDVRDSIKQKEKIRIIYGDEPKLPQVTAFGIEEARGEIIGVLDSDDMIYQDAISSSVSKYTSGKVGFTWSKVRLDSGGGRGGYHNQYEDLYSAFMASGWWQAQHFRTFSKKWYNRSNGLRLKYPYAVDFNLALCMAESGCECIYIPKFLYWYRSRRPSSMSNTTKTSQRQCYLDMKKEWRDLHKNSERSIRRAGETKEQAKRLKSSSEVTRKPVSVKSVKQKHSSVRVVRRKLK